MLPAQCDVEIKVFDQGAATIGNANVSVIGSSGTVDRGWTDAKGKYQVRLIAGQYRLHVEGSGFEPLTRDLKMAGCAESSVEHLDLTLKVKYVGDLNLTVNNPLIPLESASVPTQLTPPPKPHFFQRLKHLFSRPNNG